ncbi:MULTISPECIES: zinc-ribbon domain-containing protein [Nostocales]|uniref:Zinc-ribbon domain-containing protein n=3 Tax=Nostocales TaxID=1161 RepID=A0A8S9TCD1_9CYAN|nr:zinc-ribbon domain-containing protein [Tolypothrix bouteillei VB521301]
MTFVEYGKKEPLTPVQNDIFRTNCGQKNPANSNFCFKCGSQLIKF